MRITSYFSKKVLLRCSIIWLLLSGLLSFMSFVNEDDFQLFLKKMTQYVAHEVSEKVYLQLDKPYYAVGDDIWFKAYVTTTNEQGLSDMSKVLYVELMNQNQEVVKTAKLPLVAGLAWGDFQLDDKLEEGNYSVRAYTQYMRNFDSAFFFHKSILIGKAWANDIFVQSSFKVDSSAKDMSINVQNVFVDASQQPLSKMPVSYMVEMDGQTILKSSAKTDELGKIQFNFNNRSGRITDKKSGIITLRFTDKDGKIHTQFVPIQNDWDKYFNFFPEGGSLVEGLQSVLAFKANVASGKGIAVQGKLYDNEHKEVASFKDTHLGMGQFMFTPQPGKQYVAKVQFADGSQKTVALPLAKKSGVVMHVFSDATHSFRLNIRASADLIDQEIKVIAHKNGAVCYASKARIRAKALNASIPLHKFPDGIITFTILGEDYLPLAERIIFNQQDKYDGLKALNLKPTHALGEKMNLHFRIDSVDSLSVGSYSVSVTNTDIVKPDLDNESNILSYELLSSELRGYVERPNYYFNQKNEDTEQALDHLLLTQGWRNFDWRMLPSNTYPAKVFPIEKGIALQGTITKGKKPVSNAKVTVLSNTNGLFLVDTLANDQGEFQLQNLDFVDSMRFVVQARTQKNQKYVDVDLSMHNAAPVDYNFQSANNVVNVNDFISTYVQGSKVYFDELTRKGILQKTVLLDAVTVVGKREQDKPSSFNMAGAYDYRVTGDVLNNCFNLLQCLQGRIPGLMVRNNRFYLMRYASQNIPMQLVLDGMPIDSDFLQSIVPQNIESVEALTGTSTTAIYGSRGVGGVLLITSKRGTNVFANKGPSPGIATVVLRGYTMVRTFYTPDSNQESTAVSKGTTGTTIFWKPDIVSDKGGKFDLSYTNGNTPAHYRMVIEGIDVNGYFLRRVFEYDVQ